MVACTDTSRADVTSSSDHDLRLDRERACDRDALALAARELVRIPVERTRAEPDEVEEP